MGALEQGFTSDVSTPALVAHTLFDAPNTLKDASTILFEVFDKDGAVSVAKASGNIVTDRLALGTYAPTILIPTTHPVGKSRVRWYFEQASDPGNELFYDQEFEILPAGSIDDPLAPAYAFVHELRDEGISPKLISDRLLYNKICIATDFVEMQRFNALVERFPDGPFTHQSSLLLAQCRQNEGSLEHAVRAYRDVLTQAGHGGGHGYG